MRCWCTKYGDPGGADHCALHHSDGQRANGEELQPKRADQRDQVTDAIEFWHLKALPHDIGLVKVATGVGNSVGLEGSPLNRPL